MKMTKLISALCLSGLLAGTSALYAKEFKDNTLTHVEFPAWFSKDPFNELNQELATARSTGKQGLMVVYSTQGCSYCGLFIKRSLENPDIATTVKQHFSAVGLEIFDDAGLVTPRGQQTTIKDFSRQEGVMFSPTVLFYDENGHRILRITGYQPPERFKTSLAYVIGKHYLNETMADYVKRNAKQETEAVAATPLRQDPLFSKPPYPLQRNIFPAQGPLLVIFEKPGCEDCAVFHDKVLADGEVRRSLQSYEVVRLDSTDTKTAIITPDGRRLSPAAWYKQEGFSHTPALMFFSEQGQTAIKTDNLVLRQRMMNSIHYMNERAYTRGWSYQRFARSKAIERNLKKTAKMKAQ